MHEPFIEKEIFQVMSPIDSYVEGSDPVADSIQIELRRSRGRPTGGSQSRNDDDAKVDGSD